MNNNEMISKIITLNAVSARITRAGVVNDVERSIINHLTSMDLPFAESLDAPELTEYLAELIDDMIAELPAPFASYLDQL